MKLLKEGKPAYKPAGILNKIFLLILLTIDLPAQIPLNGFYSYSLLQTGSGYQKILPVDFNADGFKDLFVFNSPENKFSLHINQGDTSYTTIKNRFFYYPITGFSRFKLKENNKALYLFISRQKRLIGLSSFTDYGTLLLLNELNLDGYPSSLLIADVDGDGANEALLSGENFNGITIISEEKFVLKSRKIFENRVFSSPVILDLDYDSYPDIAAFDILNNSLVFLINDRTGNFKIIRSLAVEDALDNIKVFDFNKDNYHDLIASAPNGINIFYGDSVSSFNKISFIATSSQPSDIEIGDFNTDTFPDISFFSKESGELYLIIQKPEADHFFDPILLSVFPEGEDLTKIKTGKFEKLALLNNNGNIALVKRMKGIQDSSVIKIGGIPNFVRFFNMEFRQKPDILFVDDWNNTLNILGDFGKENWRNYFTFNLSGQYSNFYLDNSSSSTLNVFAYSHRNRLIEKVGISFNENNAHRSKFYTKGSIYDLKYKKEESLNSDKLTILSSSQKELLRENFLLNGDQFSSISIDSIDSDVVDAVFSSSQNDNLYYWVKSGNSLFFKKFNTSAGSLNREILYKLELSNESKVQVITIPLHSKIFHPDAAVCILSINNKSNLLFYDGKTVRGKNPEFEELGIKTLQKHFIHTYRNPYSNREFLFFYDPVRGKLYRIRLLKNFLEWTTKVVLESKNLRSYFPGNFQLFDNYVMFIDSVNNYYTIKKLK